MKKPTSNTATERKYNTVDTYEVNRVRQVETKKGSVIFFTLVLNDVSINNCRVAEGKNGDFISLPQYRGNDGKWYSLVFFSFSPEDEKRILAEVERQLNE